MFFYDISSKLETPGFTESLGSASPKNLGDTPSGVLAGDVVFCMRPPLRTLFVVELAII